MNINHLGDAFDFWKGSFMRTLGNNLNNIKVLPMFTDVPDTWNEARLGLYAQLLGVNVQDILRPAVRFTMNTRGNYFQNLDDNSDLFVDPDTGIEPPGGGDYRHIRLSEIAQLLPNDTNRVVLIYQHSFHKHNWTDACLQRIIQYKELNGCYTFAYWAGSVSMVFIARDQQRLTNMYNALYRMTNSLPDNLTRALPIIP
jgi:hypothetical protein